VFELLSRRLAEIPDPYLRFQHAAVVVLLAERPEGPAVLLERRANHLRQSPGEVGLPGGRLEAGEGAWQAALRELQEEVGIAASAVRHLGALPVFERRRGEMVHPFAAGLEAPFQPRLSEEVAEAFWLPLARRGDFRYAECREGARLAGPVPLRYLPGRGWGRRASRPTPYLEHEGRLVWGLTADILVVLSTFL